MTIPNANRRVRYEGNSATTRFTFDFKAPEPSDLLVVATAPNGNEATLALDVDYSVTGAGSEEGGFVTYPLSGSPLPPGSFLTILRNVPFTQTLDIANQGPWLPEVVEAALDRLTILTQQLLEQNDRALRYSAGSAAAGATLPSPNGAALLGYSDSGQLVTHPLATATLPREVLYASGEDATPGYLADKLAVGTGLSLETVNPGGFESLSLSCPLVGRVSEDDATPGFLYGKILGGEGVVTALGGEAGDERLLVASLGKARSTAGDNSLAYLSDKIDGGPGVTVDTHSVDGDVKTRVNVNGGGIRRVTAFTSGATYSKPEWLKFARVHVVGSGAGGYYSGTGGGPGGGAGGYAQKLIPAGDIGATVQVTVGAGGGGGTSGDHNGSAGNTSSFGSHCSATGGAVATGSAGGAGGAGSGGDVNMQGETGGNTTAILALVLGEPATVYLGGRGGAAPGPFGGGSAHLAQPGMSYGGGGGGAVDSTTNGGAGAGGIVVVEEYSL